MVEGGARERIFIDFNQNARDRTIAAGYSARRTPTATVSTPVSWEELVDVDPLDCTIATVPALLARRGDPMADIDSRRGSLDTLIELVERDERDGLGDMPYPPSYPKMPGSPSGCNRQGAAGGTWRRLARQGWAVGRHPAGTPSS